MITRSLLLGVVALAAAAGAASTLDKSVPAINEIEKWQQVGQQPYEFTWVQRERNPATLVDFEDLAGWKLELYNGAQGEFRRSREQQLWGQHVGKFLFYGTGPDSRVVARPPKPIAIPGAGTSARFNSVDMWGYGYRWGWVPDPSSPPVAIAVLLTDARGKEHRVPLGDVQWKQWWLIHRRIAAATLAEMVWPASVSGIEISKIANKEPRYFYCDDLAVYTEPLDPLTLHPQPKRNLAPFPTQIAGLNTGPGTLPFPTREETILPENRATDFQVNVRRAAVDGNRFELEYKGPDATVLYEYRPRIGALGEITVRVNGGTPFRPLDGGGLRFAGAAAESPVAQGELISASLRAGNTISASFRFGPRAAEYELRLWGKSLVLDVRSEGGEAAELDFGQVDGVANPRLITVPYLTYGATNPRVLLSGAGAAHPVFTSIWFDWYRSNASEPYYTKQPRTGADFAQINGGMRYIAKTDGRRNPMYERIFITNSPVYEEALPVIANPPSLRQSEGKQVLWTVTEPESFEKDHERCRKIRAYGIDKVMQHSHEVTWRDEGESTTMRIRAAPLKGGDAALQRYIAAQGALGWLQGTYSNYTDFAPTNSNWTPDFVIRQADADWKRAWPRNYALKPAKAVELDEYYAQRIKEKYGITMSYTDVHSAVAPWNYCDFDARVPGAGTLAATFYAYGQLLLNDQRVYGPTQSEATYQWLYAGLESGSYGWVYTDHNLLTAPLDVAFQTTRLHPLEAGYGMGYTFYYLEKIDPKWSGSPKRREYLDLFLATTIAYGNLGWLVTEFPEPFHWEAMARSYYMLQQLQQQYAFVRPKTIEYAAPADGRMMTASEAHATGAIAASRLHMVYENGTEVFVNRSSSGSWTVRDAGGKTLELPVSGWLAFNPKAGLREFSAQVNGRRIDYVTAPEFEFLDGRGVWTEQGSLGCAGSVARRMRGETIELIDIYGNDRIAFETKAATGQLLAYDEDDRSLGRVQSSAPRSGWIEFRPIPKGRRYVFATGGGESGR
jgi:hypothetical protein